ncbi:hypothetical protein ACTJJ0_20035 [Chitinophaga sp. 22321]|uniref:hypothetical protein n=1 Tax=Chitinophaga TaxID=79328 RepID=UPI0031FEEC69
MDAVAFQDGHIDYSELEDFFRVNKMMADRSGLQCRADAESFDRDLPIKFLPVKVESSGLSWKPPGVQATTKPAFNEPAMSCLQDIYTIVIRKIWLRSEGNGCNARVYRVAGYALFVTGTEID